MNDVAPRPRGRRRNRTFLVLMLLTPVILGGVTLVIALFGAPADPSVKVTTPAGYKSITDPYFGYAIPSAWKSNSIYTDDTGDVYNQGTGGWVGENESVRKLSPSPGELAPAPVAAFGLSNPTPYQLVGAEPVRVPGANFAYEYRITRGGQVDAVAIDAWVAQTQTEMWLVVHASPSITQAVLGSLTTRQ